ncbi:hypothetical protein ACMZOO_09255 [Catenovulum sp. SX2]|uniref:hypothetical protein n=1 Tax=Catenovulum sp. SX2 TaxID=3398614 RepID=UPI003F868E4B
MNGYVKKIKIISLATIVSLTSGCASLLDAGLSQAEVPTLERNVNRVTSGMALVKVNSSIENMPIASDSEWPKQIETEITEKDKKLINTFLNDDPYVSTQPYTVVIQEDRFGGLAMATPPVTEVTFLAYKSVMSLYGDNHINWPDVGTIGDDLSNLSKFTDGKLKRVKAVKGKSYPNISYAVISLMPINFQKDLQTHKAELDKAVAEVASIKGLIGTIESTIESKKDASGQDLSEGAIAQATSEKEAMEVRASDLKTIADEKERIYLEQLDAALEVLKSDIRLNEEQIELAKNIHSVSSTIRRNSRDAGAAFSVALLNIINKGCLANLPAELETLAAGKLRAPVEKQTLFDERVKRLSSNALYTIPAIGFGAYYAIVQANMAGKYQDIAEVILEADKARKEQEVAEQNLANNS